MGAFNTNIQLTKLESNSKEVVFIPMKHVGTEEFYNDTKKKIDSLKLIFPQYLQKIESIETPKDTYLT